MASKMIVHGIPGSPYVRAALLTLEEKGADYELAAMAFGTLETGAASVAPPVRPHPAFEHDGWMLYETQAIMRYVDEVVPGPRLQPQEPRAAARMNQLMGIADWYVMPQVSMTITFNRVVAPRFNRPVDEEKIAQAIPNARICMAEISRLLDGHSWMTGDTISLADLLLAAHLSMFAQAPEGAQILQEHKKSEGLARAHRSAPEHGRDHLGQAARTGGGCRLSRGLCDADQGPGGLILISAVAGPASAEVKSVTPNGFEVASVATIAAPPDRAYAALGEVGRWWSPSHTFSRDAANSAWNCALAAAFASG